MSMISYDNTDIEKKIKDRYPNKLAKMRAAESYILASRRGFAKIREDDAAKYRAQLVENFELREDHLKLLKKMEFIGMYAGDSVSIGVDGKRPFGGSWFYKDVAKTLGWELPNDDLSNEQVTHAVILMDELPLAVNEILRRLKWSEVGKG